LGNSSLPNIKTSGVLCDGQLIKLGWPEEWEYDSITELRNDPRIRKWFLDSKPLDKQKNREWLRSGLKRPYESILSIRWKEDDSFLGTIGWSNWDVEKGTAWFGRLAVDKNSLKKITEITPKGYIGIAVDAALTLRDFAFTSMKLKAVITYYFQGNKMAENVNKAIGLSKVSCEKRLSNNCTMIETVNMKLTYEKWKMLK